MTILTQSELGQAFQFTVALRVDLEECQISLIIEVALTSLGFVVGQSFRCRYHVWFHADNHLLPQGNSEILL